MLHWKKLTFRRIVSIFSFAPSSVHFSLCLENFVAVEDSFQRRPGWVVYDVAILIEHQQRPKRERLLKVGVNRVQYSSTYYVQHCPLYYCSMPPKWVYFGGLSSKPEWKMFVEPASQFFSGLILQWGFDKKKGKIESKCWMIDEMSRYGIFHRSNVKFEWRTKHWYQTTH